MAGSEPRLEREARPIRAEARFVAGLGLFAIAYYLAFRFGMSFSHAAASPFWFPDPVLLAALLATPRRRWWMLLAIALPIRLFSEVAAGLPSWFLLATFAIDAAKCVAGALLLRRFVADPMRIATVRELALFAYYIVFLIPAVSALLGAAARAALGHPFGPAWEQWFLGNAMTHLVVTPAIFYGVFRRPGDRLRLSQRWLEASALAVGLILSSWIAFEGKLGTLGLADPRLFAPIPFLLWAAVRFGMTGTAGGVAVMTFFCIRSALLGFGPFTGETPENTARILQQFLAVRVPALYLVAIVVLQMRRAEDALRQSEYNFRALADTTPVMMWMSDPAGRLVFVNQSWLEFTGGTRDGEVGKPWVERLHPDDCAAIRARHQTGSEEHLTFSVECRLRGADGAYRWFLLTMVPRLTPAGDFLGFIGSSIDLSAQKDAAREMERSRTELAHVSRVATLGELTASLAHELKQPLSAILLNAEAAKMMLDSGPADLSEIREILEDIRTDDRRASEVLGRMRRLMEKHDLERVPIAVNDTVEEILRLLAMEAAERKAAILFEPSDDAAWVSGDRVHLQQVVMNLVLNGLDAMAAVPEDRRRLAVRTGFRAAGEVEISVTDSGRGIADEQLPHLFEPFWTTKKTGLGMGLSISRSIVEAHDGKIWAESGAGGAGATFHVVLPALEREGA